MLTAARKVLSLFPRRSRWVLLMLFGAQVMMGLLQVAGVGSILPFVAVLTNPEQVERMAWLAWIIDLLDLDTRRSLLFTLGLAAVIVLVISNAFVAVTMWLLGRFSWRHQFRLSRDLLARYMANPYSSFLERNTADLGKNILGETQQLTSGVVLPALQTMAFGVSALFIVSFLIWLNPVFAGLVALVLGGGFLLVYGAVRRTLTAAGQRRFAANRQRFKAVMEALGGMKEIKILGREQGFVRRYERPGRVFAKAQITHQVASQLPRYAVEVLGFGGVLMLVLYVVSVEGDVSQVVPVAGVYAFAGYRLMPALQQIYQGISQLRFNAPVIDEIVEGLSEARGGFASLEEGEPELRFPCREGVRLERVSFAYPGADVPAVADVSLSIPANSWVAFAGETGAGKTTLVDVILGLLPPDSGRVLVDGHPIGPEDVRAWQRSLGYVPQEIFLSDDTVEANIAFGIDPRKIDREAVERAARIARIHDFVVDQLPERYETRIGERGVRLSGGQRQRIGIARALYHEPRVLILDEATNALDGATEALVLEAIEELTASRTVLMIAHRLTSVRRCDRIFLLHDGRLVAEGTYDELLDRNARFRAMAG